MIGSTMLTEETRRVVERYDSALQKIALLKNENRSLKESIRMNEVKALRLIRHYQNDIDERTNAITRLYDERRAQEQYEEQQRQRQYSDKSTCIEEGDFKSREVELEQIIFMLEDEIQALKDNQHAQQKDFERQTLHNEALAKKSFNQNLDVLRSMATDAVSAEVADALSELLRDNERLSDEFREVLNEMERLQVSKEALSKELVRTRRELDFTRYREKLLEDKLGAIEVKKNEEACSNACASDDVQESEPPSNSLEEYFKESLRLCNV